MKEKTLIFTAAMLVLLFTVTVIAIKYDSSNKSAVELTETESRSVIKVDIHRPQNVHEEMNPSYDVTLDNGSVIKSRFHYAVGDTIRYFTYKKVNN